jgi:hypothetical protein
MTTRSPHPGCGHAANTLVPRPAPSRFCMPGLRGIDALIVQA